MINFKNNLINFRPNFNNFVTAPNTKSNRAYSNLAPLKQDTISFTGTKSKEDIDLRMLNRAIHNEPACNSVSREAHIMQIKLEEALYPYFQPYMIKEAKNKDDKIIHELQSRTKSPSSIKEKLVERYVKENKTTNAGDSLDSLFSPDYIKGKIGDLVGARVIMANGNTENTTKLIDALIEAVEDGVLHINKIENYISRNMDSRWKYFQETELERLRDAVNEQRRIYSQAPIGIDYTAKDSGYMALHLDIDLSSLQGKEPGEGFSGEIQLVGYDVAKLKDVEDLCYKLKTRNEKGEAIKEIKAGHCAYKPFEKHLYHYFEDPNYTSVDEYFALYTKRAYQTQRKKNSTACRRNSKAPYRFPTIEECALKGKLPPQLDFNVLAKIKEGCDLIYNNTDENLR